MYLKERVVKVMESGRKETALPLSADAPGTCRCPVSCQGLVSRLTNIAHSMQVKIMKIRKELHILSKLHFPWGLRASRMTTNFFSSTKGRRLPIFNDAVIITRLWELRTAERKQ